MLWNWDGVMWSLCDWLREAGGCLREVSGCLREASGCLLEGGSCLLERAPWLIVWLQQTHASPAEGRLEMFQVAATQLG